jgi:hypothetical protein
LSDPHHIQEAIDSVVFKGDLQVPFYKATDCAGIDEIALLWGVTVMQFPNVCSYLLLPRRLFEDFRFVQVKNPNLHPYLSDRHYEVRGLEDHDELVGFVRRALSTGSIYRFPENRLKDEFRRRYPNESEIRNRASDSWKRVL